MTQVFFYHGAADRLAAACALISGAHAKKRPLVIYAPDLEIATTLDRMLWTQSQLSFVPHCRADAPLADETPTWITDSLANIQRTERLMNLDRDIPPDFERFNALVEVVGQSDEERLAARERVRTYKDKGCEVSYFDLASRA